MSLNQGESSDLLFSVAVVPTVLEMMVMRLSAPTLAKQMEHKMGTMIIIKEKNLASLRWKLSRIVEMHSREDNVF